MVDLCLTSSESDDSGSVEEEWPVIAGVKRAAGMGWKERKIGRSTTSAGGCADGLQSSVSAVWWWCPSKL